MTYEPFKEMRRDLPLWFRWYLLFVFVSIPSLLLFGAVETVIHA